MRSLSWPTVRGSYRDRSTVPFGSEPPFSHYPGSSRGLRVGNLLLFRCIDANACKPDLISFSVSWLRRATKKLILHANRVVKPSSQ